MGKFILSAVLLGIGCAILGGVVGMFVDHVLGTSPWIALAGSFFGLSAAFFIVQFAVTKIFASINTD